MERRASLYEAVEIILEVPLPPARRDQVKSRHADTVCARWSPLRAVELFAGAGGLALGVSLAGFKSLAVVEWDKWACDTIRENQHRGYPLVAGWPLHEGDVRTFDWSSIPKDIELLAGGPPCQPFSMGGKHRAYNDNRDMFPATTEVIRTLRPKAFIVENVKGLTRSTFANYYQYILLRLELPEMGRNKSEDWFDHLLRLQKEKTSGRQHGLTYNVVPTVVNAADYGIPQRRERVFIVGFRSDLGIEWCFPEATHSRDGKGGLKSWRTVRDALKGLPEPSLSGSSHIHNHRLQEGARQYPGHTGSPLDLPAKTLKAGDHGVPGGENMLRRPNGSVRYFTVRESARLQTFPDGYVFHGSWTETMRQLGNAVPVELAHLVASSVAEKIIRAQLKELSAQGKHVRETA